MNLVQHLSVCFLLLIRPVLRNIAVLIRIGGRATITMLCVDHIRQIIKDRLPIVIYTGHSFFLPAKFKRCVPLDMTIKGSSVSPTLGVDLTSISTSSSSEISPYLCLPQPLRSVHSSIKVFQWRIAVNATLRGVNEMLRIGWLPHQPSSAFDDVSTPVFDRALVIVIPSHILESVQFPLPERRIIRHHSHKLLDSVPILEAWEKQSGVFCLLHVVIVHLQAVLLDPTLDIFVLFTCRKCVVGIVL